MTGPDHFHDAAVGAAAVFALAAVWRWWVLMRRLAAAAGAPEASRTAAGAAAAAVTVCTMVPVYALASLASLVWVEWAPVLDLARDAYEGLVLTAFVAMSVRLARSAAVPLPGAARAVNAARIYAIVKPAMAALGIVGALVPALGWEEGVFGWTSLWMWATLANNAAVSYAMAGLMGIYSVLHHDLPPSARITPKLLCVKAILFLAFWQGCLIALLAHFDMLPATAHYAVEAVEYQLQDLLMVVECWFLALAHEHAFILDAPPSIRASAQHRSRTSDAKWIAASILTIKPAKLKTE
ncbi:transmembrane protein 184C [Thecamonas trahens ATCC 50062]|uniref:Transmembrane protein 184C n=1 Tax=Thecamonas trahens ATCC 50062 TaxID=461836 RepID=A0A0L0DRU7_THETB|nr:transmembrane protein 184C [Thecamonas trahens ATCC 50062]KNC54746.1 transmembrane protein 184C [Thecamonas trahens ATCC 50062]|eukprot:XP_013761646.1 transmembrane protein 184C [Thecamonas trahens ATCC 50062]